MIQRAKQKQKNIVKTIGRILIPITTNQGLKVLKIIKTQFKAKIQDKGKDLILAEATKTNQSNYKRNISNYIRIALKIKISILYPKKDT